MRGCSCPPFSSNVIKVENRKGISRNRVSPRPKRKKRRKGEERKKKNSHAVWLGCPSVDGRFWGCKFPCQGAIYEQYYEVCNVVGPHGQDPQLEMFPQERQWPWWAQCYSKRNYITNQRQHSVSLLLYQGYIGTQGQVIEWNVQILPKPRGINTVHNINASPTSIAPHNLLLTTKALHQAAGFHSLGLSRGLSSILGMWNCHFLSFADFGPCFGGVICGESVSALALPLWGGTDLRVRV